jgi:type I restriction enzyme S subunit
LNTVALGQVANFVNGAAFKPADWSNDGFPIIRIQNLTSPDKSFNRTTRVVNPNLYVEPGDLLVSWSATLGVFVWSKSEIGVLNQHIFRVMPDEQKVDKNYLRHALAGAVNSMNQHVHGATMKHINRGEFLATPIPLPPLPEQRRIASILDQASERLTADDRHEAGLAGLADSIYNSVATASSKSVFLGDIAGFVRGVTFKPESVVDPEGDDALRFMRTTNVKQHLDISDVKAISRTVRVRPDQMLRNGDILVSTANSWNLVGRASYVDNLPWECTFGGFVSVLRLKDDSFSTRFLNSWFTSSVVQTTLRSFGQQTTNISNLNLGRALTLPVPRPAPTDLERFEARIREVDDLRTNQDRRGRLNLELFQSIQNQAFRGEL